MSSQSKSLVQQYGISLSPIMPANPGDLGFPPGLPTELAMGLNPIKAICEVYGLTRSDLEALTENPIFKAEFEAAMDIRAKEGGLFKLKARIMAEAALETQFKIMDDATMPPAVRLKASENIIEAADRMPKKDGSGNAPTFAIQINMNG